MSLTSSWATAAVTAAALLWAPASQAQNALYAFGPDGTGTGRVLTQVSPAAAGVAVGNGSTAFNGGLVYSASTSLFYAIENDSSGGSYLTSFGSSAPTTLSTPIALGNGFLGGLALDTGTSSLYAIGSDFLGNSTFYGVGSGGATALGSLGFGYYGGLTYDAADNSFYAIGADDSFVQRRVSRITLSGGAVTVTTLFDLGDGSMAFNGGLAYDSAGAGFSVIGNDSFGNSTLYHFTAGGAASLTSAGSIGVGYVNVGLAYAPAGGIVATPVPEPSTTVLLVAGIGALALWRRRGVRRG